MTACARIVPVLSRIALVSFAGVSLLLGGAGVRAQTYQESFPSTGIQPPTQDEQLRLQGWCGGNAGDVGCANPPGTPANQGGEGAISTGAGQDGAAGFAFWSQTGIGADSFLYTEEIAGSSFVGLTSMSWYQRDSGSDPLHVAVMIEDDWYISDSTFTQPDSTMWLLQSIDFTTSTFFTRTQTGNTLPDGGVGVGGAALPTGQPIDAVGFWWDGPKTATSRIDNVTVQGVPSINSSLAF
jgi:hypothetical protein